MQIRSATKKDIAAICSLWQSCFGDSLDYIDFYIRERFDPATCALLEIENEIVGMIHLLPCELVPGQKAFYWYAAGIRQDMRNQGLFRKFAGFVAQETQKAGYANVCVPAKGLEFLYQSLGFTYEYRAVDMIFKKNSEEKEEKKEESITVSSAKETDFCNLACGIGDTSWNPDHIAYAFRENSRCNGKQLKITRNDQSFVQSNSKITMTLA